MTQGSSKNKIFINIPKRGFILLFALLISSVMLTAGLAISRIMIRQIYMTSVQRDSQLALFAADTGLECGRYWSEKKPSTGSLKCNDFTLIKYSPPGAVLDPSELNSATNFFFNLGKNKDGSCVQVDIMTITGGQKKIVAKGYNVSCDSQGHPAGGRIVERELAYIYTEVPEVTPPPAIP